MGSSEIPAFHGQPRAALLEKVHTLTALAMAVFVGT